MFIFENNDITDDLIRNVGTGKIYKSDNTLRNYNHTNYDTLHPITDDEIRILGGYNNTNDIDELIDTINMCGDIQSFSIIAQLRRVLKKYDKEEILAKLR